MHRSVHKILDGYWRVMASRSFEFGQTLDVLQPSLMQRRAAFWLESENLHPIILGVKLVIGFHKRSIVDSDLLPHRESSGCNQLCTLCQPNTRGSVCIYPIPVFPSGIRTMVNQAIKEPKLCPCTVVFPWRRCAVLIGAFVNVVCMVAATHIYPTSISDCLHNPRTLCPYLAEIIG